MMPGFELPSDGERKNIPVSEFEAGSEVPVEFKWGKVKKRGEEPKEKQSLKSRRISDFGGEQKG
ncbi:MAG: hypothetical protein A2W52_00060 [Candidatus Taylorbacteria bacterium RIFCSPHIGHO2_02_49_25]|uniref:Uncharacterized protein n=1 Tax=Candidatus Taylorbacteria bacterium RIFCSPHIGHO2_02_49_25 TaxID=1802305 RepID=A0A1G2MC05_9BACT|nr:MAG: hypothetical protein UY62_C0029G0004 [Parcubacteria group bacterium GW2011_GWF2_50_9]OHA21353.1 MAG: hypothetical protein A2W52_00060 [Candidatus Taylorbacteria bacterium RIFCSPHIGHO2_02_49_25]OHA21617.1 MAG: hypothetical protein A2759_01920 [Candidatus Taylorbacteria bacterium RIFCSPHIGHO2_01_FULL_49_60]OHA35417.1 MAG: hypothetical protein A2W65_04885 [Candidatus Taylorbacteria bacterium RIFCSPLOWO2_02_50_13]OHA36952.1 MAG: hypothetical protein A3B27_00055 [Candidatus Taylorbacteria ba